MVLILSNTAMDYLATSQNNIRLFGRERVDDGWKSAFTLKRQLNGIPCEDKNNMYVRRKSAVLSQGKVYLEYGGGIEGKREADEVEERRRKGCLSRLAGGRKKGRLEESVSRVSCTPDRRQEAKWK